MRGIASATGQLRSAIGLAYAALTHTGTSRLTRNTAAGATTPRTRRPSTSTSALRATADKPLRAW